MSIAARLSTFVPKDSPTASLRDSEAQQAKAAYDAGYEAGVQAGAEAVARDFAERQDQLTAQFLELISDQRAERTEAQAQVLTRVAVLLETIVARLAPALARTGLAGRINDHVARALATRPDAMPEIHCAPDTVAALAPLVEMHPAQFRVIADPMLTPVEARVSWDDGFDRIDPNPLLEALLQTVSELADTELAPEPAIPPHPHSQETAHVG